MLQVEHLSICFGSITALDDFSFELRKNEILSVIGPNGAGKTTLLNCLSCLYKPTSGNIIYKGESLLNKPPYAIPKLGIARTFQRASLFPSMSVLDNIKTGMHSHLKTGFISNGLRLPWAIKRERELHTAALKIAAEFELEHLTNALAVELPIILQKRVEFARAMITQPQVLFLDEPASGLNHEEIRNLKTLVCHLRDKRKLTILMVEHNMNLVMQSSDRIIVLNFGNKIAEGTPEEIQHHSQVRDVYLGKEE